VGIRGYLDEAIFGTPESVIGRWIRSCALVFLFLAGVAYWIYFFNGGRVSFTAIDWVKETTYLDMLRLAIVNHIPPWLWSATPLYLDTRHLAANPEILLTPDLLALPLISNSLFAILHVVLLYTIGFIASVGLSRRVSANLASLAFFWLLFNFNGFVTSHLAIGHFQWSAYFLLPVFLYLALAMVKTPSTSKYSLDLEHALWIGLLIGFMILNGSVHFAYWCSGFLVAMLLWRWTLAPTIATALVVGVALGLGRLVPAALYLAPPGPFISGYPDLGVLLSGLMNVRLPEYSFLLGGNWGVNWWWEYDIYIGFVALVVASAAVVVAFRRHRHKRITPLIAAAAVLFLFSLGDNYALFRRLVPVLASSQRTSSRFVVLPFLLMLFIATEGLAVTFRRWPRASRFGAVVTLPVVAWQLAGHARNWTVAGVERLMRNDTLPAIQLVPIVDAHYTVVLLLSWSVSFMTLCVVAWVLWRRRHSGIPPLEDDWLAYETIDEATA